MDPTLPSYVGFVDGASRWSLNLASAVWVIDSLSHELIHIDGMCVSISTNNQVEYDSVVGLLTAALHLGICHLDVFLDSQLLVSQLNNCYRVRDPCLFRKLRCIRHFLIHFKSISFVNVPKSLDSVADQMENDILEWHINHHI